MDELEGLYLPVHGVHYQVNYLPAMQSIKIHHLAQFLMRVYMYLP